MKKLALLVFSVASLALSACGGLTPQSACEQQADPLCEKMWNCPGSSGLKVGDDLASCKTQYRSLCVLASGGCSDGKTFDAAAASSCVTDLKAQSCDQYAAGQPATCANQCK
ncbi:MAG: hypothetical protein AB1730_12215 [Myxococcota bacterium]